MLGQVTQGLLTKRRARRKGTLTVMHSWASKGCRQISRHLRFTSCSMFVLWFKANTTQNPRTLISPGSSSLSLPTVALNRMKFYTEACQQAPSVSPQPPRRAAPPARRGWGRASSGVALPHPATEPPCVLNYLNSVPSSPPPENSINDIIKTVLNS